jgi:hypothetical protein
VGVHPSTVKGWITRGRREGEGPHADFARDLATSREVARARPGALTEDEFRDRLEESVRAGSVSAMTLWAKLFHRDADTEAERPRSMVDELARRRMRAASGPILDQ